MKVEITFGPPEPITPILSWEESAWGDLTGSLGGQPLFYIEKETSGLRIDAGFRYTVFHIPPPGQQFMAHPLIVFAHDLESAKEAAERHVPALLRLAAVDV